MFIHADLDKLVHIYETTSNLGVRFSKLLGCSTGDKEPYMLRFTISY